MTAALSSGLSIRRCLEPRWDEEAVRAMSGPMFDLDPEAFREGLVGLPGAIVWDLEKAA